MHDIAADDAAVIINNQRTIATFTDRADITMGYALGIVSIAELEEQLLLHVVADNTFIGNGAPYVFVLINVND